MTSRIGIPLILLAAWLTVFWAVLGGGQALWYGDIGLYFAPLLHFQREALLSGHIPLWNPLVLGGTPFVGNPQAWPLYPSSSLLYVLSAERAVGVIGALHCLWAMLGIFLFLRRSRGTGSWGAALGALTFGLSAAIVSKCQFPNMVQAASWLPWLLWSLTVKPLPPAPVLSGFAGTGEPANEPSGTPVPPKVGIHGGGGGILKIGGIVALAILSAHPQMTWMQALLCIGYVFWQRPKRADVFRILGGVALGVVLAMGYLWPVAEVAINSVRPKLGLNEAARFYLPPYMILTNFVAPNFYGNPYTAPPYIGRGNYWEPGIYAGVIPIAFGLRLVLTLSQKGARQKTDAPHRVSFKAQKREGPRWTPELFWGIVFLLSLWLSVGKAGGLYYLAYWLLPGAKTFHDPARFLHLTSFALAVVAAYGFDALKLRDIGKLAILGVAALDIALFARTLNPTTPVGDYAKARQILATKTKFEDEKAVWKRYVNYRALDRDASVVDFLSSGAPNTPMLAGRASVGGYEPVRLKKRPKTPPQPTAWRIGLFFSLLGTAGLAFLWHNRHRDRV